MFHEAQLTSKKQKANKLEKINAKRITGHTTGTGQLPVKTGYT